jgi:outer membrane protein OmpA-like peptidoglycan-associated protein
MKSAVLAGILMLGLMAIAPPPARAAGDVPQLGANPSSDQLIDALTPRSGSPGLKFRGLHMMNAHPGGEKQGPMPAVGLDIRFELGSAHLTDEAQQTIKQLAAAIGSPQLAKYHFLISGHTDSIGRKDHNLVLSKERAQAVETELVKTYGIDRSRLQAVGRGQTQPIDPADPANPANRRVEVVNLGQ